MPHTLACPTIPQSCGHVRAVQDRSLQRFTALAQEVSVLQAGLAGLACYALLCCNVLAALPSCYHAKVYASCLSAPNVALPHILMPTCPAGGSTLLPRSPAR